MRARFEHDELVVGSSAQRVAERATRQERVIGALLSRQATRDSARRETTRAYAEHLVSAFVRINQDVALRLNAPNISA